MAKICEYCGNTSGKENQYGQCISCGGNLTIITPSPSNNLLEIARRSNGIYSMDEIREQFAQLPKVSRYSDVTGSSYRLNDYFPTVSCFMGVPLDKIKGSEVEKYWDEYLGTVRANYIIGEAGKECVMFT